MALRDIRFWIVFFFLIRLIGITNAPLEMDHNWRQSLTNMTARNFVESGIDFFHPKIDIAGNRTGIIGSEFPIFNALIAVPSYFFGYSHWYGRLINLIATSLAMWFFYLLIKKISSQEIAFTSTLLLLTSLWFMFARKSMPDTFSVSLMIIGIYYLHKFLFEQNNRAFLLSFFLVALGGLSKIPAISLLAFTPLCFFSKALSFHRKTALALFLFLVTLVVGWWYFFWVPYLVQTYQFQLYFPKGLLEGLREILPLTQDFLKKFYFSALSSYLAFVAFAFGIYFFIKKSPRILVMSIGCIALTFLLFTLKTGAVFPLHNYYVLPFVPVMAFVAAFAIQELKKSWKILTLVLISLEAIANQQHDFFIKPSERYKLKVEETIAPYVPLNAKVIVNGGPSPQDMYFAHRHGWTFRNSELTDIRIDSLANEGAEFLVFNKHSQPVLEIQKRKIFENNDLIVFQLQEN